MTGSSFFAPILVVALASGVGCKGGRDAKAEAHEPELPLAVSQAEVKTEQIERRVDITGTLAAWDEALVSLEVEGRIAEVAADLGDFVTRGAVLVRVTPVEFAWRKAQSDAEWAAADTDYRRLTELAAKNMVAKQQLDEARRRLEVSKAAADLANKKYADTSLRAPFAGQVAKRMVNAGEYARPGVAAFQIVNATTLKFKGDVPQRFATDVTVGNEVLTFTETNANAPLKGTVSRVGPAVSLDSRSFPIEARIDNHDGALKAGSFARVSILTRTIDEALTIPETAVFHFAGNPRVFVIADGRVKEQPIEVAGKSLARVLVAKGLTAGQKVAATSVELLSDGRAVTVR